MKSYEKFISQAAVSLLGYLTMTVIAFISEFCDPEYL
jgi:hypothetical protein